jgi:hypothetical protein
MNQETARLHINTVIDESLPEPIAERLSKDDTFFSKHYDGLIHAISVADPRAENPEAAVQAASDYVEVLRQDIAAMFPKDYIQNEE